MAADRRPATRVVHAGLPSAEQGAPLLPGPVFAAPFHLRGDVDSAPYAYGRYHNPTWAQYEAALGELEGGLAVLFSSGMAAVSAVLLGLTRPGDLVVVPSDCYGEVRAVAARQLADNGVKTRFVPTHQDSFEEAVEGARLVWAEIPSNPLLDVLDLDALARAARRAGALLAVDHTLATPLALRPLAHGADLAVCSDSKAMSGHSDLVLGHVAVADEELAARIRGWRTTTGAIAGPFEAWLAHRSLATLDVRLRRACANAQRIAELLDARDDVTGVRYPGLASHPAHELAARQLGGLFGAIVSFELADAETAQAFFDASELVAEATSFGGVHTMAERRARWGADDVSDGFVRLSAGVEDGDDLVADLTRALDTAAAAPRASRLSTTR
jgi:cystathionine gamma-lyase